MVNEMRVFFFILVATLFPILIGCASEATITTHSAAKNTLSSSDQPNSAFDEKMETILKLISDGEYPQASYQLNSITEKSLTVENSVLLAYAKAVLLVAQDNADAAYLLLMEPSISEKILEAKNPLQTKIGLLKADLLTKKGKYLDAIKLRIFLAPMIEDQGLYQTNHQAIWNNLKLLTPNNINNALQYKNENEFQQWLSLSQIVQHDNLALDEQITAIGNWQNSYPNHPATLAPPPEIAALKNADSLRPKKIAVILPFDSNYRTISEAIRDGFMNAYYKTRNRPQLGFYSTDGSQNFLSVYNDAIQDGADLIIGPLLKNHMEELYTLEALPVTTIALNKLEKSQKPANLHEFSLSAEDEIKSIIKLAMEEKRHTAIVIAQDDSWAQKNIETFNNGWIAAGNSILDVRTFRNIKEQSEIIQSLLNMDKSMQRIQELQGIVGSIFEHQPRTRQDIDMIMIFAKPESAISLRPLIAFHFTNEIPIYSTSSIYRGYPNPSLDNDLNGICFSDIPLTLSSREKITEKYSNSSLVRMYAFGIDAFQLTERIRLMESHPDIKLYGSTGLLTLDNGVLSRQASFARFVQGEAKLLPMITIP